MSSESCPSLLSPRYLAAAAGLLALAVFYGRPAAIWLTALLVAPAFLVLGMALMGKR